MRTGILGLAIILGFSSGLAHATEPLIPEQFQGIYATPSCDDPEYIYGTLGAAEVFIDRVDGGASLSIVTDVLSEGDWTVVVPDDPSSYWLLRLDPNGRLEVGYPLWPSDEELAANPDLGDPDPYDIDPSRIKVDSETPVPCDAFPPDVSAAHGEGYAFLSALDMIAWDCGARGDCLTRLFGHFDVSQDGQLNRAEIARAMRGLAYVSVYGSEYYYETQDFVGAFGLATLIGPGVSELLLRNFDYDGDEAVSLDEILLDRPGLRDADFPLSMRMLSEDDELGDGLRDAIDNLGRTLR